MDAGGRATPGAVAEDAHPRIQGRPPWMAEVSIMQEQ